MTIKVYNPTTSSRRKTSTVSFGELTKKKPEKRLLRVQRQESGRNNQGRITITGRGGGNKRHYRLIDNRTCNFDQEAKVIALEYDPNRSARLALVCYQNGKKSYIVAPQDLKVGDRILTTRKRAKINLGNRFPLKYIPIGTSVYDIELVRGKGGQLVRSAGAMAVLLAKEGTQVHLKLPSGEVRIIKGDCLATIGQVSNLDYENIRWGKAGRMRHRGKRPDVRGKAMNPVDHPHGGGEGNSPIGMKHPKTRTGKPALGFKTRKKKKFSNRYILKRRTGEKLSNG